MSTLFPHAEIDQVVATGALGLCILLMACGPVRAQPNDRRPAPSAQAPTSSTQDQRGVRAPGTDLPSAAEPARPPSSFGQPSAGSNPPGGTAQMNTGPDLPDEDDGPNQVPLGGAEWLAAAGAAYALKRLRKDGGGEDDGE